MMKSQQGKTLIGMLFTMVVVVFAAILVMRVVPVYLQHYSVVQSVKSLKTVPLSAMSGDSMADASELRKNLSKRLEINDVEDLKGNEVVITPVTMNKFQVKLKYQVIKPLLYNISLLFNFDDVEEVTVGSEN